jgi:ABC-type uncharacterized transport system substrate-binding protein
VTGISALAADYAAKSLQLLKEAAPRTSRVGVVGTPAIPTYAMYRREFEAAARTMGIAVDFAGVHAPMNSTLSFPRCSIGGPMRSS